MSPPPPAPSTRFNAPYTSSKGRVAVLTRQMVLDFSPYGITVNAGEMERRIACRRALTGAKSVWHAGFSQACHLEANAQNVASLDMQLIFILDRPTGWFRPEGNNARGRDNRDQDIQAHSF
jgi:NAD(P)-dependent dehydrogenase (short-subunit alcohol dehydrogenase family)